jgi:hypothetical protein
MIHRDVLAQHRKEQRQPVSAIARERTREAGSPPLKGGQP